MDNIKKSNIVFTRWARENCRVLLAKPIPLFHNGSWIWGDFKFSFEDIVSIIICWFSFAAKWTTSWSCLSLLKWKSWWIMAHFPYYALSSSLEMMHGLKLTKQKTKSSIGSFFFLQLLLTNEIKSSCCTCCTQWPPLLGTLNPLTVAAALLQSEQKNPAAKFEGHKLSQNFCSSLPLSHSRFILTRNAYAKKLFIFLQC